MKVTGVIWLRNVIDKLAWKHDVTTDEVEEIFSQVPRFRFIEDGVVAGENVYAALGRTEAGRYLVVYFIYKPTKEALVVSAREMTPREKKAYGKR
jgi:uncharacterized protein